MNTVYENFEFVFWDSTSLKPQLQASRHSLHGWQLPNVCLHSVPGLRSNSSWNKHTLSNKRQRMFAEAFWNYLRYYCNQRQKEETINEWNNVSGLTTSPPLAIHLFCGRPCKLEERQRLHGMPMAMWKEGLHRYQRGAFWTRGKKEEMGRETDQMTAKDNGIQRNGDRTETETETI